MPQRRIVLLPNLAAPHLRPIDDEARELHHHLRPGDRCFSLHDYTAKAGYEYSAANNTISNLKKKPGEGGYPKYKNRAIARSAEELARALDPEWLAEATIVPLPPSKIRADPGHDDRMLRVCLAMSAAVGFKVDVRELLYQTANLITAHENPDARPTPAEIENVLAIDESLTKPVPKMIGLIDDVLTAGAHFRAADAVIRNRFPGVPLVGLFVARRVFLPGHLEDQFDVLGDL